MTWLEFKKKLIRIGLRYDRFAHMYKDHIVLKRKLVSFLTKQSDEKPNTYDVLIKDVYGFTHKVYLVFETDLTISKVYEYGFYGYPETPDLSFTIGDDELGEAILSGLRFELKFWRNSYLMWMESFHLYHDSVRMD